MYYDLDILEEYSGELGFSVSRPSPDSLKIEMLEGIVLEFQNLRKDEDTVAGFIGTPTHWHGKLTVNTSGSTYVELDELDVVRGLRSGELLIVERYLNGSLSDRWVAHKKESLDVQYVEPGEEMRILRLP
jgi:hypothetical protein